MSGRTDADLGALIYLAEQHYRGGRLRQAKEVCQRALAAGECADAILLLARIAHRQRQWSAAAAQYQRFLRHTPEHAGAHANLAAVLERLGQREAALAHLRASAQHADDRVAAQFRLGDACAARGRWAEGCRAYEQAAAQAPDNAAAHARLGATLYKTGQTRRAIDSFKEALRIRPHHAKTRLDFALVLRQLGRTTAALGHIEHALRSQPDDVDAHVGLAATLRQEGKAGRAGRCLEQLLARKPACGAAYHQLALLNPTPDLGAAATKALADPQLPLADAIHCHFALGHVHDAAQSPAHAFDHFQRANALRRRAHAYDSSENRRLFERIADTYCQEHFENKRSLGCTSTRPVFVVGLPRSGTTLVEQILASHPAVHGAGEMEALAGVNQAIAERLEDAGPAPECMSQLDERTAAEFSSRYLDELTLRSATAKRVIDKAPGNFARIGLIKTLFPRARIVHCVRQPLDNCLSLFFHDFPALLCSHDLVDLGRYHLDYQRLVAHWRALFPGEILDVQYEELVGNAERVSKRMIDYLGLDWDVRCLAFHETRRAVMSPSNLQVRRPLYRASIDRWKPYAPHLGPLMDVLGCNAALETPPPPAATDPAMRRAR